MAKKTVEPDNLVLAHLRELRAAIELRFDAIDERLDGIEKRLDTQRRAFQGESVLGRYAAVEVEERLAVLERDIETLKAKR